jgi:hypothetical protein
MLRAVIILAITLGSFSVAYAADTPAPPAANATETEPPEHHAAEPVHHTHHVHHYHHHRFHPVHEASELFHDATGTKPVHPKPEN